MTTSENKTLVTITIGKTVYTGSQCQKDENSTWYEIKGVRGASCILMVFPDGGARRIVMGRGTSKDFTSNQYTIETLNAVSL